MHPSIFHQWKWLVENSPNRAIKRTFLIGMPRSGTTLWARCMENACHSRTVGDKALEYYQGFLMAWRDIKFNDGYYCDYREAERKGIFADMTRGYHSREAELANFRYLLANALFANTFQAGFAKCTILGFTNNLLVPFVKMLREVFADDDLTICYMTRNIQDAASSLVNHPDSKLTADDMMNAVGSYEYQLEQMREATELGDVWIKYEDFVKDPMPFLRRSRPLYPANTQLVKQVMDVVLR